MPILRAGLIGEHISRSRLSAALDILCAEHGWSLDFDIIDTAQRDAFDLPGFVDQCRANEWTGLTITHPWKLAARAYAGDAMKTDLAHLGAANTLTFRPKLAGHNTDYSGFLTAFEHLGLAPGRVVMMGAGGVAEALAHALRHLGATDLAICDINDDRAQALATATGARVVDPRAPEDAIRAAGGLVNATPLGMAEYPGTAFDPQLLGTQTWAFDAVYTPTQTMFLRDAKTAGLAILTGFDLFRSMALRSFEAYTGLHADASAMQPALDALRPD